MTLKIVIDTNLVFSAILNPRSKIGKLIINSRHHFTFYTCDFLRTELLKHRNKILKLTRLSQRELDELEFLITKNIIFINEALLPEEIIVAAENALIGIDINDTPFVALTKHLEGKLWTGDKELIKGLQTKNFIDTLSTDQLSILLDELETEVSIF